MLFVPGWFPRTPTLTTVYDYDAVRKHVGWRLGRRTQLVELFISMFRVQGNVATVLQCRLYIRAVSKQYLLFVTLCSSGPCIGFKLIMR